MSLGIREDVRAFFEAVPAAVAVYIFGSTARGFSTRESDVDIAVLFAAPPASTLMGPRLTLEGRLEEALGRAVDLVVLNTAPADLVHRILRDGDLVLERDRGRRIEFEVARRNEYFDLQPLRDRYRREREQSPARVR